MPKAVLSTNDLSKLWLSTLGFKDGFEKNRKITKDFRPVGDIFLSTLPLWTFFPTGPFAPTIPSRLAHTH